MHIQSLIFIKFQNHHLKMVRKQITTYFSYICIRFLLNNIQIWLDYTMLMFDNSIFASFIPQIIMLMGYLMCLIAPFMSQLGSNGYPANYHQDDIMSSQIVVESVNQVQYRVSCVHFDDVNVQVISLVDDVELSKPSFTVIKINLPEYNFCTMQGFCFRLFSRPPPFSCWYLPCLNRHSGNNTQSPGILFCY